MFVKIKYFNVKKGNDKTVIYNDLNHEILYDCKRFSIGQAQEVDSNSPIMMLLTLDVGEQDERIIKFPAEQDREVTEIYIMNDIGKTIDRYIY